MSYLKLAQAIVAPRFQRVWSPSISQRSQRSWEARNERLAQHLHAVAAAKQAIEHGDR